TGEPGAAASFYDAAYRSAGEREVRWRELGAVGKADHVERLLAERPERLVEIGCGDGALLAELGRRGAAGSLQGFDVSAEVVRARVGTGQVGGQAGPVRGLPRAGRAAVDGPLRLRLHARVERQQLARVAVLRVAPARARVQGVALRAPQVGIAPEAAHGGR